MEQLKEEELLFFSNLYKYSGGTIIKMKVKIIMALLVLGMTCLSGCENLEKTEQKQGNALEDNKEGKEDEEEVEMQVYRTPTEKEMEILEGCNLSSDYMKEIEEKGMSISVQSFVDTAQIMLGYLEEKYGEKFAVVGGEIPGIISGDYMIFAKAVDGEYAGERFEVYYKVDEEGNGYCEDGYFAIIKSQEFQEMMQKRADAIGAGWKVLAVMEGTYGETYGKDTISEDMKPSLFNGEVRYVMTPEKIEEEFRREVEELKQKNSDLSGLGKGVGVMYCQMLSQEEYDKLQTFEEFINILIGHTEKEPMYREIEE